MTPSSGPSSSLQFGSSSFNALSEMERFHKPSKGISPSMPSQITATDSTGTRHMAIAQRITPGSKMDDNQNVAVAPVLKQAQPQAPLSNISNTVMTPEYLRSQNAYMTAIFEEMQTFDKEILELKKSSQLLSSIGTKEEMEKLKLYTMNFEEFNNDMSETMVVGMMPNDLKNHKTQKLAEDGDRFNSCQVIYSQFSLAIHQNDHQARRRFVEWAQKEIAVVPDFHKRILFSNEAHFWLNSYVNKQNCRIWSEANPQVYVETPLHPEKLTVWCALWAGGILLQKR
ncbi:nuclear pore complex protein Nup214 [Trichonephila clavipes]|nr:nuclear pore complex protein Nup214 [Trichonephila clavipes]